MLSEIRSNSIVQTLKNVFHIILDDVAYYTMHKIFNTNL